MSVPAPMPGSPAIINALLRQLADDSDSGTVRTLEDYQSLFPGYEDTVAHVLEKLSDGGTGAPSATGSTRGDASDAFMRAP